MGLVRTMVGILAEYHHAHRIELGIFEGVEYITGWRVDQLAGFTLLPDEGQGLLEVRLLFFCTYYVGPACHKIKITSEIKAQSLI